MEKNMQKYEAYRKMYEDLGKAMKNGFYYEAIFIEYAVFEDRLTSLIKYAGLPTVKKGRNLSLVQKLNTIRSHKRFSEKFIQDRLKPELLNSVEDWKDKRNNLIHDLANMPYGISEIKEIAEEGNKLLREFKNKTQSVINHIKKNAAAE